jgi:hypothetical protein
MQQHETIVKNLKNQFKEKIGYELSDNELKNMYTDGSLNLTDAQESALLIYFNF